MTSSAMEDGLDVGGVIPTVFNLSKSREWYYSHSELNVDPILLTSG
jgi:hypothetical protein